MFRLRLLAPFIVASLGFFMNAHANEPTCSHASPQDGNEYRYEGVDALGRIVRLTLTGVDVRVFERLPTVVGRYPEPNWTSRIGTGAAAKDEH
jgi:hypothetical protein